LYSFKEIARVISMASGKEITYVQLEEKVYRSYFPVGVADMAVEMLLYYQEFGYFGPRMRERVSWSRGCVKGDVSTFEDFLERNPLPSLRE